MTDSVYTQMLAYISVHRGYSDPTFITSFCNLNHFTSALHHAKRACALQSQSLSTGEDQSAWNPI